MKTAIFSALALVLSAIALPAQAAPGDPRVNIDGRSCGEARAIVAQNGAAILRYTSPRTGIVLYDRFVRNGNFCEVGQIASRKPIFRAEGACSLRVCITPDRSDCRRYGRLLCDD